MTDPLSSDFGVQQREETLAERERIARTSNPNTEYLASYANLLEAVGRQAKEIERLQNAGLQILKDNDPMTPARTDRCRCTGCGEYFKSASAFDRHRTGPYTARRCLTVREMLAKGLVQSDSGHWMRGRLARSVVDLRSRPGPGEGIDPHEDTYDGGRRDS